MANAHQLLPRIPAPLPVGLVQEARTYALELRAATPLSEDVSLRIDGEKLLRLYSADACRAVWRWDVGFFAGLVTIELQAGAVHEFVEVVTDPDLAKISRNQFATMVKDILEDSYACLGVGTHKYTLGKGEGSFNPPIARLEYLRQKISEISDSVKEIIQNPVRYLVNSQVSTKIEKAKRVTTSNLLKSLRHGRFHCQDISEATLLKDAFPASVYQKRAHHSLDTREHRDIKRELTMWMNWLFAISFKLELRPSQNEFISAMEKRWTRQARSLALTLKALIKNRFFDEVSDRVEATELTWVYRRKPPYRKFYKLQSEARSGLLNIVGDFLQVPLSRTFELYELWCFFRTVRALVEIFPGEIDLNGLFEQRQHAGLTIRSSSPRVRLPNGAFVFFQRTYREYWMSQDLRGSYSREMRPDIAIEWERPSELDCVPAIILDAKYRIDAGLNASLNSIHTYRDALVEAQHEQDTCQSFVRASYILSPFLPVSIPDWKDAAMPSRLFHPLYRRRFRFGALSMVPGDSMPTIVAGFRSLFADAGVLS